MHALRLCKNCQKPLIGLLKKKFCSRQCGLTWHHDKRRVYLKGVIRTCPQCGTNHTRGRASVYCSPACAREVRRKTWRVIARAKRGFIIPADAPPHSYRVNKKTRIAEPVKKKISFPSHMTDLVIGDRRRNKKETPPP